VLDHLHRVEIRFRAGSGRHAEVTIFRIDRPQTAVRAHPNPRDIVSDREHLPSLEPGGRRQHREIGLAACARKSGRDVGGLALGTLEPEDQHVLCEPSFVASERTSDSKRETLLAQQRIAAVAAADGDDRVVLWEMTNEPALGIHVERAMNSAIEIIRCAELRERGGTHPRHDSHVQRNVDAIGQLDADLRERRPNRSHHVRHHVHRAPAHRSVEPSAQPRVGLGRVGPIVGRAGFFAGGSADERQLLGARDVVRVGAMNITTGTIFLIKRDENSGIDSFLREAISLGLGAVAPHDRVWPGQHCDFLDPIAERAAPGRRNICLGIRRHVMRSTWTFANITKRGPIKIGV
jgi:hypothetical protein